MSIDIGVDRSWHGERFPPPQPCDWLAFDIETANSSRSSICAVGIALVRGGELIASGSQLINPGCDFSPYHSALHGIDAAAVKGAPTFAEFWPQLFQVLDGQKVVAHYASFDIGGLRQAVAKDHLTGPTCEVYCSWRLAKRVWPDMPSHSLGWVAPALGVNFDHHEAGADAAACAAITLAACSSPGADLASLSQTLGWLPGRLTPDSFRGISLTDAGLTSSAGNPDADPDHPLFGATVCFTGGMFSMVRRDAAAAVVNVGGNFVNNMSSKVDFLVIGDGDFVGFADGQRTGKIKRLLELRDAGKTEAEVVGERDFLSLLFS